MARLFEVRVNGRNVDVYNHKGLLYIEGRKDSEYQIHIKNPHSSRVKAVVSVDGISVLDGEPASKDSQGYIIVPFQTIAVGGWRVSDAVVRAFKFADVEQSYSSKSGNGESNVGVIAVRLYEEKTRLPVYRSFASHHPLYDTGPVFRSAFSGGFVEKSPSARSVGLSSIAVGSSTASVGATMDSFQVDDHIGTGQGAEIDSSVRRVSFTPVEHVSSELAMFYDTRKGLEKRGIVVTRDNYIPNPFPGDSGSYCKSF